METLEVEAVAALDQDAPSHEVESEDALDLPLAPDGDSASASNPGLCGCSNIGLANLCYGTVNLCNPGFSPQCNPQFEEGGQKCGTCTCT